MGRARDAVEHPLESLLEPARGWVWVSAGGAAACIAGAAGAGGVRATLAFAGAGADGTSSVRAVGGGERDRPVAALSRCYQRRSGWGWRRRQRGRGGRFAW